MTLNSAWRKGYAICPYCSHIVFVIGKYTKNFRVDSLRKDGVDFSWKKSIGIIAWRKTEILQGDVSDGDFLA
jgi:DNA-directed RNA polymerase subunit RPC12/RpoP